MTSRIEARPAAAVPAPAIVGDDSILESFLSDAAHVAGGVAAGVAFPANVDDVAATIRAATRVLPIGAQSSLTGGATPRGDIVLSTRALTSLALVDSTHVRAGAGVSLATLQQYLAGHGLYYPPVPTFDGAFVGGTIATNAAGAATFKYGSTRHWVEAITVVLADGGVLDIQRGEVTAAPDGLFRVLTPSREIAVPVPTYRMPAVPKLSAGYHAAPAMDLIDLFIGSEGTLGVITGAVLRVIPRPARAVAVIACRDDHHALALTAALRERAQLAWVGRGVLDVSAIEYMDERSLRALPRQAFETAGITPPPAGDVLLLVQIEIGQSESDALEALAATLDAADVTTDPVIAAAGDDRGAQRLFDLREAVPAAINAAVALAKQRVDPAIEKTAGDFIVPFERLEEALAVYRSTLEARGVDYAIWGHVSDGNLHVNVVPRTLADVITGREALIEIARDVIAMGGSPLAEHGVGRSPMKQLLLKMLYGEEGIEQMRAVKRALDPEGKLGAGVLFPAEVTRERAE